MNVPDWLLFSVLTLAISLPFYWTIWRAGGANAPGFNRRFRLMLWIPGVVAAALRLRSRASFAEVGYGAGSWPLLLLALLLPLVVEAAVIAMAIRLKWRAPDPDILRFTSGGVEIGKNFGLLISRRSQSIPLFSLNLVLSTAIGAVYTGVFAFGQEFGWRGYLFGQLADGQGVVRAVLIVSLIWAIWYLPLVLMGYRFPGNPGLGALVLMPLTTFAMTVVAVWLYLSSGSIWAPTLLHASVLVTADLSTIGLGGEGEDLRLRSLWVLLWIAMATLFTFFWPGFV